MPDPRDREFLDASVEEIVQIVEATQRPRLRALHERRIDARDLRARPRPRSTSPSSSKARARSSACSTGSGRRKGAVLFATSSFWQGVDVQGEALSCVIISKLPFAVPSDPVVAARQKYIDDQGGNSFYEYSVPEAIITLEAGAGPPHPQPRATGACSRSSTRG